MRLSAGSPARLGASWDGRGTNFALFSANAEKVELCLFDGQGRREIERIELPERNEDVWHGYLNDVSPGQLYGYRVHGPYAPERGHRFNPNKLLLDPYARRLAGRLVWSDAHFGFRVGSPREDLSFEVVDREKAMVRLGAGGLDGKALTSESMSAALQALTKFKRLAESHRVDKILAAATSATREARNGGEFLAQVERQTGIRPRVITGAEEAHLIHQAAVYGVDHPEWGQEVKAVIVPEPGAQPDPVELARWCGETLAAYKVPTQWEIRREPLPRNPSGKILKNVLAGQAASAFVED